MGETMEDRVDLALTVRELGVKIYSDERVEPNSGNPVGRSGATCGRGGTDNGGCFPFSSIPMPSCALPGTGTDLTY